MFDNARCASGGIQVLVGRSALMRDTFVQTVAGDSNARKALEVSVQGVI